MALTVSLIDLRTRVRERTHYENSQFVTDAELNAWLNDSYRELYDWLTQTFEAYNVSQADFPVSSGNLIPLPDDFYKLLGVDLQIAAPDQYQTLPRIQFSDRNCATRGYDLRDDNVVLLPFQGAQGNTYRLFYVPTPITLVNDADTIDGVDGFDEIIVLDVCIKIMGKSGEGAELFAAQKAAMLDRIQTMAAGRDSNEPQHTGDVRSHNFPGSLIGGRFLWDWY